MYNQIRKLGPLTFGLILLAPQANAVPQGPQQCTNGLDNGHYYEVITTTTDDQPFNDRAWDVADDDAGTRFFTPPLENNAIQGHLVTITSALENACVNDIRIASGVQDQLWIGGSQAPGSQEPGGGWSWVNNEGIIPGDNAGSEYANWLDGEPNNTSGGVENHLTIGIQNSGQWNDSIPGVGAIAGYIIEYDGIVPADTCVGDTDSGDPETCNPSGVQETTIPEEGFVPDSGAPEATYAQTILEVPNTPEGVKLRDPRVNNDGECFERRRLDVFAEFPGLGAELGGEAGDLILSRFECGSPDFAVLRTEAVGFTVQNGVISSRQLPEEIFGDATFDCEGDTTADPSLQDAYADLQRRGVFVWQPDEKRDVLERRALELTNACGSRRGLTKGPSFFVLNLHTDCGIEFGTDPEGVLQCFRGLTTAKFLRLGESLLQARANRVISRSEYRSLRRTLARARNQFFFGNYGNSLSQISMFIAGVRAAEIPASIENFEGDLLMRAENIEFTTIKISEEAGAQVPQ